MHANAPEEAERLKADILSQFDCVEFYVTDFTPVIGTHTGPGSIGLSFYTADST
jgi:fatty acid-binding protein DegV